MCKATRKSEEEYEQEKKFLNFQNPAGQERLVNPLGIYC